MEDIVFGSGIVTRSHLLKYINNRKYIIIADSEVYARYPEIFDGLQVFCAPSGEEAKSFETYIEMVTACNIAYLTRGGVVVAVGGGAVLDAAGFLASTYKRGVSLIKVPTTVIAMCDAAIGGKNAINSHSAKNEIGTFYSAEIILGDIDFLHTLPDEEIRAGLGEMIKYAIGFAPEMLETLQDLKFDDMDSLLGLIRRAAELKQKIVEADFRESGDRKLLNFGHTLAHAIEFATDFKVSHGSAVAVGVYYMSRWAHREGRLQEADMDLIDRCYDHLNLPRELPRNCNKNVVFSHVLSDKKMVGDDIDLVKLYELGSLEIVRTSLDAFYDGIFKDSFSNRGLRGSGKASSVNAVKEAAPAVIDLPVSKSYAHRFFILAAFADFPTVIEKFELSEDIRHTVEALKLMSGARFEFGESEFAVVPRRYVEKDAEREETAMYTRRTGRIEIDCGSSASTARFLIPFSNIRTEFDGVTYFYGSPSLENRPMNSIIHVLKAQNLLSGEVHTGSLPFGVKGRFKPGIYRIPGNITSQFLSGLLMAAPMMNGRSRIIVSGKQVSLPYVNITIDAMRHMG
ncbi:MAG: hypothetical protein Q4A41_01165, partial [Bacillota bacterium]|nr:hypothetical protein [Bacillota bacterium]